MSRDHGIKKTECIRCCDGTLKLVQVPYHFDDHADGLGQLGDGGHLDAEVGEVEVKAVALGHEVLLQLADGARQADGAVDAREHGAHVVHLHVELVHCGRGQRGSQQGCNLGQMNMENEFGGKEQAEADPTGIC
jgi:hypothetical protein